MGIRYSFDYTPAADPMKRFQFLAFFVRPFHRINIDMYAGGGHSFDFYQTLDSRSLVNLPYM